MAVDIRSCKRLSKGLKVYTDIVAQEEIATAVIAIAVYWIIENHPDNAKFLTRIGCIRRHRLEKSMIRRQRRDS